MGDIRGEKLRFRKRDIIALETLPSAQAHEPLIVHCPPKRGLVIRFCRVMIALSVVVFVLLSAATIAIETGSFDRMLFTGARAALQSAIGADFKAEIGGTSIRFSKSLHLSVAALNVKIIDAQTGESLSDTKEIKLVLDPLALLVGRVSVTEIEADGITFNSALLPSGGKIDMAGLRIDQFPAFMDRVFVGIDQVRGIITRGGLDRLRLDNIQIAATDNIGTPVTVTVEDLALARKKGEALAIHGQISINGHRSLLSAEATGQANRTTGLTVGVSDLYVTPFAIKRAPDGQWREGLDSTLDVSLHADRQTAGEKPDFEARIVSGKGVLYMDGDQQVLNRADINVAYDFDRMRAEIRPSVADFGETHLPLSGFVVDVDRSQASASDSGQASVSAQVPASGIALSLSIDNGRASIPTSGEKPFAFSIAASGIFHPDTTTLNVDALKISSPYGTMNATVDVKFGDQSPEIRFNGKLAQMRTQVIKQLWPYWMASKPRQWVMTNLHGGTVSQGSIFVFIPAGRMKTVPTPLDLGPDELKIQFDISGARLNVVGDIPPVRDVTGHFEATGPQIKMRIDSGTSVFPSGRKVKLDQGLFSVNDAYLKPLMADIDLSLSGKADAIAELVSFKPIEAMQRIDMSADDFTGDIKGKVHLHGGIIEEQHPPPMDWSASVDMNGVSLKHPYMGRKITGFDGTLSVDPKTAVLKGKAGIDGVPMTISLTQPVEKNSKDQTQWTAKGIVNDDDRERLLPELSQFIKGPMAVELTRIDDDTIGVQSDLTDASLSVPWLGWTKGVGVRAKSTLNLTTKGSTTTLDKFNLSGDGFGVTGKLILAKNHLASALFDHVKLTANDDFSVAVDVSKSVMQVKVKGASFDGRSLFRKIKSGGGDGAGAKKEANKDDDLDVQVDFDKVIGFNGEVLSSVKAMYGVRNDKVIILKLNALTDSGQAVVLQSSNVGDIGHYSLITSDAGDLARLLDLYDHMRGGLLDLKLQGEIGKSLTGSIDLRNFQLDNEKRLQQIVNTSPDGRSESLNRAVKSDMDLSSERFQRAFATISYRDSVLSLQNGIVRGEQVGASFQGVLKDARGQMEMTGTFMPAYGLNRLFAELPIIGTILGNGRDRGLIGITFKLTGSASSPNISVNPLSIIAPGVFRQIFEYQ